MRAFAPVVLRQARRPGWLSRTAANILTKKTMGISTAGSMADADE
jgi:predicted metal-dependent peptidase